MAQVVVKLLSILTIIIVSVIILDNQKTITADISNIEHGLVSGVTTPIVEAALVFTAAAGAIALLYWIVERKIDKSAKAPEFKAATPSFSTTSGVGISRAGPSANVGATGGFARTRQRR